MTVSMMNLVANTTRNYYELARLQVMDQWWHWMVDGLQHPILMTYIDV